MTIRAMNWAWGVELSPSMKLVLLKLADRANDDGECWPGQTSIAKACGICERTLMRHIDALEEMGLLSRTKRRDDSGRQSTNLYQLNLGFVPGDNLSPGDDQPGDKSCDNRVTTVSPNKELKLFIEPTDKPKRASKPARVPPWVTEALATDLPDWFKPSWWLAFVEHRHELKAKLTNVGILRTLALLTRMHQAGQPVGKVIERSILNGWTGLFDLPAAFESRQAAADGVIEQGEQLGMYPKPGETTEDFRRRLAAATRALH